MSIENQANCQSGDVIESELQPILQFMTSMNHETIQLITIFLSVMNYVCWAQVRTVNCYIGLVMMWIVYQHTGVSNFFYLDLNRCIGSAIRIAGGDALRLCSPGQVK
jgi:hypothetical protein